MHSESIANQYERAVTLAESGQYEQALDEMLSYLHLCPDDSKALNDAATILFCMRRGEEAISYFEKALMTAEGDEKLQIYWNLCETCIQEGYPERAAGLFDQMADNGILSADTLNRTAEAYLEKENLGGAIQMLHQSLKMSPNQNILIPMMEIIRGRRQPVSVFTAREDMTTRMLVESLNFLVPVELHIDDQPFGMMNSDRLCIFVGLSTTMTRHLHMNHSGGVIVILNEQEIYSDMLEQVNWSNVGLVIAMASSYVIDDLKQRTGLASVVQADASFEVDALSMQEKKRGKRIAAMGPWTTRQNPMFLIQCFQKLHYIDPDSRLYLAGEFEDEGLKRYLEHMIESMDLDNVVFLDGAVKNLAKWFKDKHYIVSTAIDSSSQGNIWLGMAYGLRPVVHQFAGADELFDKEYLFSLAEDFCDQILHSEYDSQLYRRLVSARSEETGLTAIVHSLICKLEKDSPAQQPLTPAIMNPSDTTYVSALPAEPAETVDMTSASMTQRDNLPSQGHLNPMIISMQPETSMPTLVQNETQRARSIDEIARQALEASQALRQMSMQEQGDVSEKNFSTTQQESPSDAGQILPDSFKYNKQQGLTINDLMMPSQEPTGPFCSST